MVDFNKVNPEQAKEIIKALKDGKINDKEAKDLKLTPQEQKMLNEAFSSGEVQIGDFILVNKGKSKDGKMQYSQTKKAPTQISEEEPSFLDKALNKIKKDVGQYANNFKNAWNNSHGAIETTGALIGATTKTATDMVKNAANNVEKGAADLTGSETVGRIAKYASGAGLAANLVKGVEAVGDWSADKIRNVAKNYTGTERALLEGFADFVDDMNAADIALLFAGGAGAVKYAKDLPKILKLLTAGGATMALASCAPGDENIFQEVKVTVNQNSSLAEAIAALKEGQDVTNRILQAILEREIKNGATAEEILKIAGGNQAILERILDAISQNNELLADIKKDMGDNYEKMLNTMLAIQNSVVNLTQMASEFPDIKSQLQQIIRLITEGNTNIATLKGAVKALFTQLQQNGEVQKSILAKLDEIENSSMSESEKTAAMLDLLKEIKSAIDDIAGDLKEHFKNDATVNGYLDKILAEAKKNNAKTEETNALLKKLYDLVEKLGKDGDKLGKELLNYIAAVGFEMNRNFSALLDAVENGNVKLDDIKNLLAQLNALVKKNGEDGKAMGNEILNYIAAVGFEMNRNFSALLDAVENGNVKLDDIKNLLAQLNALVKKNGEDGKAMGNEILNYIAAVGFEMSKNFSAILDAINTGNKGTAELKSLLEKVLEKQDGNTKAIIEAMGNIKVDGVKIDLSSLEKMLAELLEQSKKNGNILTNIDAKADVLNVTTKAILAKLEDEFGKNDDRYKNILNMLNAIKNNGSGTGDDAKLLDKLDKILAKLDDILAAIKDHKVQIDVTGKVTCECNCGKNHEGILGDIDDILE